VQQADELGFPLSQTERAAQTVLLGTVLGMIRIFTAINVAGLGNQAVLAGGIAEALIITVAGLSVAIPSIMFYRYFRGRVDELVVYMEQQALKMVEILHGEREND